MFATLVGPYPAADPDAPMEARVRSAIEAQVEAGLGMLADGLVLDPRTGDEAVDRWRLADALAREVASRLGLPPLPVKARVLGPSSGGGSAGSVGRVVRALAGAGAPVVQVEEDGLAGMAPTDDAARDAAARALATVCESVGESGGVHLSLAVTGGSAEGIGADVLFRLPFGSYLFDLVAGPGSWRMIAWAPPDRGIVCGVADARRDTLDTPEVMIWGARYAASLGGRGADRVGVAPSAGLEGLDPAAARRKIEALSDAARKAALPGEALAQEVDPRAVSARSAALGRVGPAPRARPSRRSTAGE
jgi:hypothetical protein